MNLNDWMRALFMFQADGDGGGGDAGDGAGSGEGDGGEGTGTEGAGEGAGGTGSEGSSDGGEAGEAGGTAMTGKTGDEGSGDAGGEGKPEDGTGAPESYTQFELPEGMVIGQDQLDAATPIFKEMGLSQENAQKLINLQAAEVDRQNADWETQKADWFNELKADKDVGGPKFGDASKEVTQFIKAHAGEGYQELHKFLEAGWGNFPPLFKLIHTMAKRTSEDTFNGPGSKGEGDKSEAASLKKMYPTMPDSSFQDVG